MLDRTQSEASIRWCEPHVYVLNSVYSSTYGKCKVFALKSGIGWSQSNLMRTTITMSKKRNERSQLVIELTWQEIIRKNAIH